MHAQRVCSVPACAVICWVLSARHAACSCIDRLPFSPAEPQLEQLLSALPSLPPQPPQLSYTAALLLSAYAEWLGRALVAGRCAGLLPR